MAGWEEMKKDPDARRMPDSGLNVSVSGLDVTVDWSCGETVSGLSVEISSFWRDSSTPDGILEVSSPLSS